MGWRIYLAYLFSVLAIGSAFSAGVGIFFVAAGQRPHPLDGGGGASLVGVFNRPVPEAIGNLLWQCPSDNGIDRRLLIGQARLTAREPALDSDGSGDVRQEPVKLVQRTTVSTTAESLVLGHVAEVGGAE